MRIAAFNVENLFDRAKALGDEDDEAHPDVLDRHAELNRLFELDTYSPSDKARMLELFDLLGMDRSDRGPFTLIRKIRGRIIRRPDNGPNEIVANGRDDWVGWCELKTAPVNERALLNTGRVIRDVAADILAVIEAESRPVLLAFQDMVVRELEEIDAVPVPPNARYAHIALIDGNDTRGIDVGLATGPGFPIGLMRSHVDLVENGRTVFSRDSPEFQVTTPSGKTLWILPQHFKSKFGGNNQASRDKRLAQARAVAGFYQRLRDEGAENIVVLGDFNDTPDSAELAPLVADTDLRDVSEHPAFTEFQYRASSGGRGIGTYGTGRDTLKIDYLMLSPALWDRVERGGIFRKGAWTASDRWDMYDRLEREVHAASDHHAIWVDLDI